MTITPALFAPGDRVTCPAGLRTNRRVVGVVQPRYRYPRTPREQMHHGTPRIPMPVRDAVGEYMVYLIADDRVVFAHENEIRFVEET